MKNKNLRNDLIHKQTQEIKRAQELLKENIYNSTQISSTINYNTVPSIKIDNDKKSKRHKRA